MSREPSQRAGFRGRVAHLVGPQSYLYLDALLLGLLGAFGAWLFSVMLQFAETSLLYNLAGVVPPGLPSDAAPPKRLLGLSGPWLIPAITTVGGLVSGWLVYTFAPEAEGHGTDTAIASFHTGVPIRARVVPIKTLASAITLGSGGSAGREGPAALISAGIGSLYATWRGRTEEERRLLLLIGAAAGLSAIFRSPIGAAIFAVEVLYRGMDIEARALIYTLLASIVAYTTTGLIVGWEPIFHVPTGLVVDSLAGYARYALLGVLAGLVGAALPGCFYGMRALFARLPGPKLLRPAFGGLCVGLIALELPQVLGGGYGWIQQAIDGHLPLALLATLVVAKSIAFALTVGSGGSGGVFGPGLYVGAMVGGVVASLFGAAPAGFVIVGMAAVFAGAARTPVATLLMVTEMTEGYGLLVPAALAVSLGFIVQAMLTRDVRNPTLYEAQVNRRADSPSHHVDQILDALRVLRLGTVKIGDREAIDLATLLRAEVRVEIAEGRRLRLIRADQRSDDRAGDLLAVLRDGDVRMPRSDRAIQDDDLLLIAETRPTDPNRPR